MNDLISRSALIKYLDETHCNDGSDWMVSQYNADWICSWIESQPAVDAVEVVRCRDCKRREIDSLCEYFDDNDFCSRGERRNGDD